MASIRDFISNFNGGTRRNRFRVTANWPSAMSGYGYNTTYHVTSASMPPSYLGNVTIPYRGREANYAGDRIYEPWDVIIIDDNRGNVLWESFHAWHKIINEHMTNTHSFNNDSFVNAKTNWTVEHLGLDGNTLKTITMVGCWPMQVSPIQFNMAQNVYNSFGARISYDYFRIANTSQ